MSIILKPLFELLTGDIAICDNILYNYVLLGIVGEFAYQVARTAVGNLYHSNFISGRSAGSILHWAIRLPLYTISAYIIRGLMWIYTFISSVPSQIWWTLATILIISLVLFIIIRLVKKTQPKLPSEQN